MLTAKELDKVREDIECEGFDYAFVNYSNYPEIEDEEFHKLRQAFLDSREALAEFLGVENV